MASDDWIDIRKDNAHIARERAKARELKKSAWWQALLQKGICHYCGRKFPPGELTMDHLVPVARGGKSTRGNIVPCCRACNAEKKYYTPAELIMKQLESQSARENGSPGPGEPPEDSPDNSSR